ncbi:MAG: NAD(P)(+) transhydrogenase (Re/Si-specific) subunit beta [Deltaproteobacteria bacterium]|nr:NAD(P)(+) transhydrogenase (Re/Si-specific) subunit beta [Deltaproteobacteria bacterium]MBW2070480.1 NAD(P)(+) transhydrogenase (Re/Si-specific) subunit beta [Deltaproteobacteria bacterium]
MGTQLINIVYLIASICFILGLKGLTSPRTAPQGNLLGASGMLLAVLATLLDQHILTYQLIIVGLVVGGAIGAYLALTVQMTAMPQMVAAFNGFGGGASALVAATALIAPGDLTSVPPIQLYVASTASGLIGAATFTGSMVAWAKLQGTLLWQPKSDVLQKIINGGLFSLCLLLAAFVVVNPTGLWAYWLLVAAAAVLGVMLTVPIGGADMPVVIALLNSYSGLAAAATGFVLGNNVLIISGSLVGASGIILTNIMCKAMNRSLVHVLFGTLGPTAETATADEVYGGKVKSASPEEAAMIFDTARLVIIVPGYGMAVAQAQHAVRDLANLLEQRGAEVRYAIHPVAGRMPGHMNVLLAEADVPYEQLYALEQINDSFPEADVALVIGANDVVNPTAREDSSSPIYGMPILDVDKARTVMIIKRSLSPGFAGIPNPLFAAPNALMLFGDGKDMVRELIAALKEQ